MRRGRGRRLARQRRSDRRRARGHIVPQQHADGAVGKEGARPGIRAPRMVKNNDREVRARVVGWESEAWPPLPYSGGHGATNVPLPTLQMIPIDRNLL